MNLDQLTADLRRDEGERLKPYRDSVGKLTIGVGRNLDDDGISASESQIMLQNDILRVGVDLDQHLPWWRNLDNNRQNVLANMCFNLGINGLLEFKHFLGALLALNYELAYDEMISSKWATEVGGRATRLAAVIKGTGT